MGTPGSQLNAKLEGSDVQRDGVTFARTGYLGFIRRTELTHADGGSLSINLLICCVNLIGFDAAVRVIALVDRLWCIVGNYCRVLLYIFDLIFD